MKNIEEKINKGKNIIVQHINKNRIIIENSYDCTLVDSEGNEYIDFLSGIGVNSLGYSNENFKNALKNQVDHIIHCSNYFFSDPEIECANLLIENSFADKVYFTNSGAEANEGALKIARKYCHLNCEDQSKSEIVAMSNSFHGRTFMAMNVTDKPEFKEEKMGYSSNGFFFAEYNNLESLRSLVNEKTSAIIIEPVKGEGGLTVATKEFLELARELADKYDAVLIFDEIQCGMGRTGKLFAHEHSGVTPDIMTLAKALGNGVPISAVLMKKKFADILGESDHSTTYGGNPLATRAASTVLKEMIENDIPKKAKETGAYFKEELLKLKEEFEIIKQVKGIGLMLGLELETECGDIVDKLLDRGFITNCTQGKILRFLPPLIITKDEIDKLIGTLKDIL